MGATILPWNGHIDALLLEGQRAGKTLSQLASELAPLLGRPISRGAIARRLHTLGEGRQPRPGGLFVLPPGGMVGKTRYRPKPGSKIMEIPHIPPLGYEGPTSNLADLGPCRCKWPMSGHGAGTQFCNAPTSGQSYCERHDIASRLGTAKALLVGAEND